MGKDNLRRNCGWVGPQDYTVVFSYGCYVCGKGTFNLIALPVAPNLS